VCCILTRNDCVRTTPLQNDEPMVPDLDSAFHFNAEPDPDPASKNNPDPYKSGSAPLVNSPGCPDMELAGEGRERGDWGAAW
jgi:hypothetical protein